MAQLERKRNVSFSSCWLESAFSMAHTALRVEEGSVDTFDCGFVECVVSILCSWCSFRLMDNAGRIDETPVCADLFEVPASVPITSGGIFTWVVFIEDCWLMSFSSVTTERAACAVPLRLILPREDSVSPWLILWFRCRKKWASLRRRAWSSCYFLTWLDTKRQGKSIFHV